MKRFLNFFAAAALFAGLTMICSCASNQGRGSSFYADNIADFRSSKLSNGIPVYFKRNRGSKVVVLRMIFEGGVACYQTAADGTKIDGIESFAFDLAQHGSKNYSYDAIQTLEFEKGFSMTSSCNKDYSSAGFTCIARDLEDVTDVFADSILNPLMSESDFEQLYGEAQVSVSQVKANPSGVLGLELSKAVFGGHPYATSSSVKENTLTQLTRDSVVQHFDSLLNSKRIKFVVVADLNETELKEYTALLEKHFGGLQKKNWTHPAVPALKVSGGTYFAESAEAGEAGYITGVFDCPDKNSSDYIPFAIATIYLDDIFFDQVREKAGAVYSMGTGVFGGKTICGAISAYKANNSKDLKSLIIQAINSMDEKEIESRIAQYKNKYITTLYSSSQNAAGVAGSIVASLETYGSESSYLGRSEKVEAVTAKQVVAAYDKYIKRATQTDGAIWVVVSGAETLHTFGF